jgi:DNA-binding NarL/FixJ family response regulator
VTTFFRIFVAIPILIVLGSVAGGTWQNLEILDLMVDGLPTSQVAARLYLAPKTIRNRISEMLGKLGVASREEAIALGRAAGLGSMRADGRPS